MCGLCPGMLQISLYVMFNDNKVPNLICVLWFQIGSMWLKVMVLLGALQAIRNKVKVSSMRLTVEIYIRLNIYVAKKTQPKIIFTESWLGTCTIILKCVPLVSWCMWQDVVVLTAHL